MRPPFWYPPVLAYHRIHPDGSRETPTIHPEIFDLQMAILSRRRRPIPVELLVLALEGKVRLPSGAVAVTFDDGTEDAFRHALPILVRHGIPATVFLIAGNIGRPGFLTGEEVRSMRGQGISFGSHTLSHDYLPDLPPEAAQRSLLQSRQILQELTGGPVEWVSYPAGGFTREILRWVQAAGYRAGFTTNRGFRRFPPDRWAVRRISMHARTRSALGIALRSSGYYALTRPLRPPA